MKDKTRLVGHRGPASGAGRGLEPGGEQGRARVSQGLRSRGPLGAGREHIRDWLRQVPGNQLKGQLPKLWGQTVPGIKDRPQEPQGDGGRRGAWGHLLEKTECRRFKGQGSTGPCRTQAGTLRTGATGTQRTCPGACWGRQLLPP